MSRVLLEGDGREDEVMVCGDDTICLLGGLSCHTGPESDTRALGYELDFKLQTAQIDL